MLFKVLVLYMLDFTFVSCRIVFGGVGNYV